MEEQKQQQRQQQQQQQESVSSADQSNDAQPNQQTERKYWSKADINSNHFIYLFFSSHSCYLLLCVAFAV